MNDENRKTYTQEQKLTAALSLLLTLAPTIFVPIAFLVFLPLHPAKLVAQSSIIDPVRSADWTSSGVVGGIPDVSTWNTCTLSNCNTLAGGTVTTTSINNAITSACGSASSSNKLNILIPAGSFNSIGHITLNCSYVRLRGAGSSATVLHLTGASSGGGMGISRSISIMSGAAGLGCGTGCGGTNPSQTATWSAGYSQGTTSITLDNVTGITAGSPGVGTQIALDQQDESPSSDYPGTGGPKWCSVEDVNCSNKGAGSAYARSGRSVFQMVTVTAISGTGPYTVTISPGVVFPHIRSGKSPGAWWNTTQIHNSGIENMTLEYTGAGAQAGLFIKDGSNLWVKGVRMINTDNSTAAFYTMWIINTSHVTIQSSYFYGKETTASPFPLENYTLAPMETSDLVHQNNIHQRNADAIVPNDPTSRNVYAFNYVRDSVVGTGGAQPHGGSIAYDDYEGNDWESYFGDVTHGAHSFITLYRNVFTGTEHNNAFTVDQAIAFLSYNRYANALGNVIGSTHYTTYERNLNNNSSSSSAIWELGWIGNNSGTTVSTDAYVKATLFRYWNWDYLTSTSRTSTNDTTGIVCNSSDVPSGDAYYPNAVPSSCGSGFPASLYLTAKPAWFGSVPFPPIGPDVTNGNATNTSTTPSGGHANKIPARVCFESLADDPNYAAGTVKLFDADTCYAAAVSANRTFKGGSRFGVGKF